MFGNEFEKRRILLLFNMKNVDFQQNPCSLRSKPMLRRIITDDLTKWKEDGAKTALCITGARQIGKSTSAREFARAHYKTVIEINFIEQPQMKEVFNSPEPSKIYTALTAASRTPITPGETLLMLDEIQECPQARTAVKFLVEDHQVDLIETGSLLGVNIQEVKSYPVGFETLLPMYPMTFLEFLWALKIPEQTIDYLKSCYQNLEPVLPAVHAQMLELFQLYMVVGGMPKAVQTYVDTSDLVRVQAVHQDIIDLYRSDILKYALRKDRIKIQDVFDQIPGQLMGKNKRFKVASIDPSLRVYQMQGAFLWLEAAGIGLPCYNVTAPLFPLRINEERNLFKLYLCDTGLLCTMTGQDCAFEILKGNVEINMGGILENIFAQSLKSRNFNLFYFDSKRNYELDFLVQNKSQVEILEIKSGKYYKKHASLNKALDHPEWHLKTGIVFCKGNIEKIERITYLPFYMILFYEEEREAEMIWKPDLSALMNFN